MLKVIIVSERIDEFSGVSAKTGNDFTMFSQVGYFDLTASGQPFPEKFKLNLEDNQKAWPVGEYALSLAENLETGKYGGLGFVNNLVLVPFVGSKKSAA